MDVTEFSSRYSVRILTLDDVEMVYALCLGNPQYYVYCPPDVSHESIIADMGALPPGVDKEDKYYTGFFDDTRLVAVMDMIDHYHEPDEAYIGFFMVAREEQRKGIGSAIVAELCEYLAAQGYRSVGLGWMNGNAQAEHFWKKNGFVVTGASGNVVTAIKVLDQRTGDLQ